MKRIELVGEGPDVEDFPEDISRIVKVFADQGYEITRHQARRMWEKHSEDYCAGWLSMEDYSDNYVFSSCGGWIEARQ